MARSPWASGGGIREFGLFRFGLVCGVRGDTAVTSMATIAVLGALDTKEEGHRTRTDRTGEHRPSVQFFQGPKLAHEKLQLAMFADSYEGRLFKTRREVRVETLINSPLHARPTIE